MAWTEQWWILGTAMRLGSCRSILSDSPDSHLAKDLETDGIYQVSYWDLLFFVLNGLRDCKQRFSVLPMSSQVMLLWTCQKNWEMPLADWVPGEFLGNRDQMGGPDGLTRWCASVTSPSCPVAQAFGRCFRYLLLVPQWALSRCQARFSVSLALCELC